MKLFRLTTAIAIAFMALSYVDGNSALADTHTSVGDGRWQDAGTWDNGVPHAGDDVVIAEDDIVTVEFATAEVNCVVIRDAASGNAGKLHLKSGATLKVRVCIDVEDTQAVPGEFDCIDDSGTRPIVQASNNGSAVTVTLDGPFWCTGDLGVLYTGEGATDGFGVPSGAATFSGGGELQLDTFLNANGGDVTFEMEFDVDSSGEFIVSNASSDMIFDHITAVAITGDANFSMSAGRMYFKEGLETDGGYQQTGGKTEVDAGETFKATGAYS